MGWTCPRCNHGVSPYISVCPCGDGGSGSVTALPLPTPFSPPFPGSSITVTSPLTSTVSYGETVWSGVTVTGRNAA